MFDPLRVNSIRDQLQDLLPAQTVSGGEPRSVLNNVLLAIGHGQPRLAVNQSITASGPTTITPSQIKVSARLGAKPGRMLGWRQAMRGCKKGRELMAQLP